MQASDATLTYSRYLSLDQILTAQRTSSDQHDEMLFIVMHQVYELWFKQLLHEFVLLQERLEAGDTSRVLRTSRRLLSLLRLCVAQLDVLETMTPHQFASFRDYLESSSGYESAQFREIEAVLGRRDPAVVQRYPEGSVARARIKSAMSRRSVYDSFFCYLDKKGHSLPVETIQRDHTRPVAPSEEVQALLLHVYAADGELVGVCEALFDIDETVQNWRFRHAVMVERIIGMKRGTAGSSGAAYLRSTVGNPAFPDLWAVRTRV